MGDTIVILALVFALQVTKLNIVVFVENEFSQLLKLVSLRTLTSRKSPHLFSS